MSIFPILENHFEIVQQTNFTEKNNTITVLLLYLCIYIYIYHVLCLWITVQCFFWKQVFLRRWTINFAFRAVLWIHCWKPEGCIVFRSSVKKTKSAISVEANAQTKANAAQTLSVGRRFMAKLELLLLPSWSDIRVFDVTKTQHKKTDFSQLSSSRTDGQGMHAFVILDSENHQLCVGPKNNDSWKTFFVFRKNLLRNVMVLTYIYTTVIIIIGLIS